MRLSKVAKAVLGGVFVGLGILGSSTVSAQQKGYAMDGSHEQVHALREDYGKGNLIGVKNDKLEFWYIVEDPNAIDWNVTLTYPRWKEGMVSLATDEVPEISAYYPWGGWAGIRHNDQVFYVSKFVPTYSERYGDYGDYDLFHSALSVATATYLTKDGAIHKATVNKIGDYAFSESDIHVIDVILYSDDNGGEDPDLEFGDYVFYNCSNFIGLPEGSPYKVIPNNVTKIGKGIFKGCSALKRMIIGDKVAVIPEETFDGCSSLEELKLGAGVKEIRCSITGLKRLAISAPVPPVIAKGCKVDAEEIWVPLEYLEVYKNAWADKNIKPYSFKFRNNPVKAFAGYQTDVRFDRVSPGEGENNYVYCYPREKDTNGKQNFLWTVDATHGSNTASGKFKTVWYSYDCDKRGYLAAGNVVYEDLTRVRFDKAGTYKLYFTTLDITNHTEEVTVEVDPLPADYVPVETLTITGGPNNHTLRVNSTDRLRYTIGTPTQGGSSATYNTVTWTSANPEIATVDENGNVTGISPGSVVITATTTDPYVPEITASYTLTVIQRMENFILLANYGGVWEEIEKNYQNKYCLEGVVGETLQIMPECYPEGTSYSHIYISKDQGKYPEGDPELEIDEDAGTILLKSAGKLQLNVGVRDGDAGDAGSYKEIPVIVVSYDETTVTTVNQLFVKEVESGKNYEYSVGYTGEVTDHVPLRVSYNANAAVKQVNWVVDKPEIAEIIPTNEVATFADDADPMYHFTLVCKQPGTTRVLVTPTDGGYASVSFPVTVNKPDIVSVSVEQKARVEDGRKDVKVYTNNLSFEIHNDGTATLVYPSAGQIDGLSDSGMPTTPYDFSYPGDIVYRGGMDNYVWSPYMDSIGYKDGDLYFTALKIPEKISVDSKEYTVTSIGSYAFAGSNVVCVLIPSTVISIGDYAFKDAKSYKGVAYVSNFSAVPNSVCEMGKGVFSGCSAMQGMTIGSGIVEIPEETFDGCSSLEYLTIGSGVERISCSVTLSGAEEAILTYTSPIPPVFDAGSGFSSGEIIYVTELGKSAYEAAFPNYTVNGMSIAAIPERTTTYIGSPIRIKYDNSLLRSKLCNYMMFYPDKGNPNGGGFTANPEGVQSNDWISMSFDEVSGVKDASIIDKTDKYVSVSFASEGKQQIYFHDQCVPEVVSEPVIIETVTGVGISRIQLSNVPDCLDVNESVRLGVTITPETATNKSISWVLDREGVIKIDEKNRLTAKAPGIVRVKAISTDPLCEQISSQEYTIVVGQSVKDIEILSNSQIVPEEGISGYPGDIIPLTAVIMPEDAAYESCEWSIDGSIAKVKGADKNASVELVNPGKCAVEFKVNQQTGAKGISREIPIVVKVPVKDISVKISGAQANPGGVLVGEVGAVYTIIATPNSDAADKNLIWDISDPGVVDMEQNGSIAILTFKKQGVASLKITAADGCGASVTLNIEVKESGSSEPVVPQPEEPEPEIPEDIKVEQLSLAISEHTGFPGDKLTLVVAVHPDNATNQTVNWATSHPNVASVNNAGEITLLNEGEALITGTAADGSGVSVTCAIKVRSLPTSIEDIGSKKFEVQVEGSEVIVQGLSGGDLVSLYSVSGSLVDRKKCIGGTVSFTVAVHGIYVVVTPVSSFKFRY